MVMEAYSLGISSCIVGRAEATFNKPEIQELLNEWELDENDTPLAFVCLGYISGEYPQIKPRNEGRTIYIGNE
jgi:nitroreductase